MRTACSALTLATLTILLTACSPGSPATTPPSKGQPKASVSPATSPANSLVDQQVNEYLVKNYDTDAKADLRTLATEEETFYGATNAYGTLAQLEQQNHTTVKLSDGVTAMVVVFNKTNGYCLSAHHQFSPHTFFWDSQAGGLLLPAGTPCSGTRKGQKGDQRAGKQLTEAEHAAAREQARQELSDAHLLGQSPTS